MALAQLRHRFRRQPGAYVAALGGMRLCRAHGIKVGLRFTMTERNVQSLPAMLDLVEAGYFDPGYNSTLLWTEGVQQFGAGQQAMIAGIASDTVSYNEFNAALGE